MALSRSDHLSEHKTDTSGAFSIVSTAFTPQSNALLVCVIAGLIRGDPGTATTVSGGGLTWTRVNTVKLQDTADANYFALLEQWVAPVGTAASFSVTVANVVNITDSETKIQCFSYTGYDTGTPTTGGVTTSALGADGAQSVTTSATPSSGDASIGSRFYVPSGAADTGATPGATLTEIYDFSGSGTGYGNLQTMARTGSTSTTVDWADVNVAGVTLHEDLGAAFIVKVASGADPQVGISVSPLFIFQ